MKSILRRITFYFVALYLTGVILEGFRVSGGLTSYLVGAIVLSILLFLVKPILNLITLPLNIITLGFFSYITNAIIIYLLTVFVPSITISPFVYGGIEFFGFIIPKIPVNNFFAFILSSILIFFIVKFLEWLTEK